MVATALWDFRPSESLRCQAEEQPPQRPLLAGPAQWVEQRVGPRKKAGRLSRDRKNTPPPRSWREPPVMTDTSVNASGRSRRRRAAEGGTWGNEPLPKVLGSASNHERRSKMRDQLKDLRSQAGSGIDPNTARVRWRWGYVIDPYGDYDNLLPEEQCLGDCTLPVLPSRTQSG